MSHPESCVFWEYKAHANYASLEQTCISLWARFRVSPTELTSVLADTRPSHREMFAHLVSADNDYYAGNYRGAKYTCLEYHPIAVGPWPGLIPQAVAQAMELIHTDLAAALLELDAAKLAATTKAEVDVFKVRVVELFASYMVDFLRIHPYANGNGHAGRALLWAGLGLYGFWPKTFQLNARPPWDEQIARFRANDKKPLIKFVLKALR